MWLLVLYVILYHLDPAFDWTLAHPVWTVVAIGVASFVAFSFDAIKDWRSGHQQVNSVRSRIESGSVATPNRGALIILACAVVVWLVVVVAAILAAPDGQHPILILILGGMTVGVAAPFLLYPAILVAGWISGEKSHSASFRMVLAKPIENALDVRADLSKLPPLSGLSKPISNEGETWRSEPVSLKARLLGFASTYRLDTRNPLVMSVQADNGDRETVQLDQISPTEIGATLTVHFASAWSRGIFLLAGKSGIARMIASIEAARLQRMLGCSVTVVDADS